MEVKEVGSPSIPRNRQSPSEAGEEKEIAHKIFRRPKLGRRDRHCPAIPLKITRDMLEQMFHLPLSVAASNMKLSLTAFKAACRKLGISRWPYRCITAAYPPRIRARKARSPCPLFDDGVKPFSKPVTDAPHPKDKPAETQSNSTTSMSSITKVEAKTEPLGPMVTSLPPLSSSKEKLDALPSFKLCNDSFLTLLGHPRKRMDMELDVLKASAILLEGIAAAPVHCEPLPPPPTSPGVCGAGSSSWLPQASFNPSLVHVLISPQYYRVEGNNAWMGSAS